MGGACCGDDRPKINKKDLPTRADLTPPTEEQIKARAEALSTATEAFNKLDLDGNGNVDKEEVKSLAIQILGSHSDEAEAREAKIADFWATFDAN